MAERQGRLDAPGQIEAIEAIVDDPTVLGPASADQGVPGHDLARASARRARVVRMRLRGDTYEQIAESEGFSDKSGAAAVVLRALRRVEVESVEAYRDLENARYDRQLQALWPILTGPYEGDGAVSPKDRIAANNSIIRLSARRARLNGMDAPARVSLGVGLEDTLAELLAALGRDLGYDVVPGEVVDDQPAG